MAADQGGPQLSELESLQLKANQVTDESLESTRRMISLCEEVGQDFSMGGYIMTMHVYFVIEIFFWKLGIFWMKLAEVV